MAKIRDETMKVNDERAVWRKSRVRFFKTSRRATKSHARKVTATGHKFDPHVQDNARLDLDERLQFRPWRTTRPGRTRLEAWCLASESSFIVEFIS